MSATAGSVRPGRRAAVVLSGPGSRGHLCEPRLATLADGSILLAYRAGSARLSPDGRVVVRRSADGGHTWSDSGTSFPSGWDGRRGDQLLAALVPAGGSRVLAWIGWMDRDDTRPWRNQDTDGRLPLRILQAESPDGGRSWRAPREIDTAPFGQAVPQAMLRLADGSLVSSVETFKSYDDTGSWQYRAGIIRSADGGGTWPAASLAAEVDARGTMWWDPRMAQLADGRLVQYYHAFDYPAGADLPVHVAWSADGGRTWSAPASTGLRGQSSWPVGLADGRVLLVQQRRHDPAGIVALLSTDSGRTFDEAGAIWLYQHAGETIGAADGSGDYFADMDGFTFGHPVAVALSGSRVLAAFYAGGRAGTSIHVSTISLEDFECPRRC